VLVGVRDGLVVILAVGVNDTFGVAEIDELVGVGSSVGTTSVISGTWVGGVGVGLTFLLAADKEK